MLVFAGFVSFLFLFLAYLLQGRDSSQQFDATCKTIARSISPASAVYYPGSPDFTDATEHWVPSSSQVSTCSVEPGTVQDVSTIVKILGQSATPFAIRSGGHATTVGFSSTLGVAIDLVRLNSLVYNQGSDTVSIGTGQTWDQVFDKLEPHGVNVAGGRIVGVGVGGLALGGGYSWLTNRHGMSIDTITAFELVLPNGTIADNVTASSAPDLFFGLKGGFNNFGLVTKITMQAYEQGLVWGGLITFVGDNIKTVIVAVENFSATNTDPDGNCILNIYWDNGVAAGALMLFYNGPEPPVDLFSDFLAIPYSSKDVVTRSFVNFIDATSVNYMNPTHLRGTLSSVSMPSVTAPVLNEVLVQGEYYGTPGVFSSAPFVSFAVEPFYWRSVVRPLNAAAYPHDVFVSPFNLWFAWPNAAEDDAGHAAIRGATANITQAVKDDGQNLTGTVLYPNYALGDATLESLYGANVPILTSLRSKYDPTGVFLRTGGFKFVSPPTGILQVIYRRARDIFRFIGLV